MESLINNLVRLLPLLHSTVINLDDFNTVSDLGRAHYEILAYLQAVESDFSTTCTMSVVAKAMNISKPYMTSLIDRLIKKGYVEREFEAGDRRIIIIMLTPKGRAFIKEHFILMRNTVESRLSCLDSSDIELLSTALVSVTDILSKVKERRY